MATVTTPANANFSGLKAKIPHNKVIHYKGVLSDIDDLAAIEKPKVGDVYNVTKTSGGDNYFWNGTAWASLENPDTLVSVSSSSSSSSDESESESESGSESD